MIQIIGATVLTLGFLLFGLPNLVNQRERDYFSTEKRYERAREQFSKGPLPDSLTLAAGLFYDRGPVTRFLFGKHHRNLWSVPVTFPVFKGFDSLHFAKTGGGMQTTSVEMNTPDNQRIYTFRSVDKDPSVLQGIMKHSALRTLLRDQGSAFNPYAAVIVSELSKPLGIWHTSPIMCVIPYSESLHDSVNYSLAGQVVLLEEEMDAEWKGKSRFNRPNSVSDTEDVIPYIGKEGYVFDKQLFLKNRLFDMLISDWDRHEGQWKWLEFEDSTGFTRIEPFPVDRDMAMGKFHDGLINKLYVGLGNKFKSFRPSEKSMKNGGKKRTELDIKLLKGMPESAYLKAAEEIQLQLTDEAIDAAFRHYPHNIYDMVGREHAEILKTRLSHLQVAARQFYKSVNK